MGAACGTFHSSGSRVLASRVGMGFLASISGRREAGRTDACRSSLDTARPEECRLHGDGRVEAVGRAAEGENV